MATPIQLLRSISGSIENTATAATTPSNRILTSVPSVDPRLEATLKPCFLGGGPLPSGAATVAGEDC